MIMPMHFPANDPVASSLANTDIRHITNVPSKPHSHQHMSASCKKFLVLRNMNLFCVKPLCHQLGSSQVYFFIQPSNPHTSLRLRCLHTRPSVSPPYSHPLSQPSVPKTLSNQSLIPVYHVMRTPSLCNPSSPPPSHLFRVPTSHPPLSQAYSRK